MEIIVTRKSNVEQDEHGYFILNDDGDPKVIDQKLLGIYTKTHCLQVNQINPSTNTLETGFIFRAEIFWNDVRSPAPSMEDPNDLVWLTIGDDDDADDDTDQDEEDSEEYEDENENEGYF